MAITTTHTHPRGVRLPPTLKMIWVTLMILPIMAGRASETVTITGYLGQCDSFGAWCSNVGVEFCCTFTVFLRKSMEFDTLENCQSAFINSDTSCTQLINSASGPGKLCFYGTEYIYGANWAYTCADLTTKGHDNTMSSTRAQSCKSAVMPNAVVYRVPGSNNGTWVLDTLPDEDANERLVMIESEHRSAPAEQIVESMKGMGAYFVAHDATQVQYITGH